MVNREESRLSDEPDLHCGDKTAWRSRWKMASRVNGLENMVTQSDASAAADNRVSGGIPAQAEGRVSRLLSGPHFDPELPVRTRQCGH